MNICDDVRRLALGFFDTIGSDVADVDGAYRITVPEEYQDIFGTHNVLLAFDEESASKHDCELVIPGSKTLSLITEYCISKGPVSLRKPNSGRGKAAIRYHFLIIFSGRSSLSTMDHVDVDLPNILGHNMRHGLEMTSIPAGLIDSKEVTATYAAALGKIKKRHNSARSKFLDDANRKFSEELDMFLKQHNSCIRDLDDAINSKDRTSGNAGKIREFRFQMADQIEALEKAKLVSVEILQKKHKVVLEYRLVACEIIIPE